MVNVFNAGKHGNDDMNIVELFYRRVIYEKHLKSVLMSGQSPC